MGKVIENDEARGKFIRVFGDYIKATDPENRDPYGSTLFFTERVENARTDAFGYDRIVSLSGKTVDGKRYIEARFKDTEFRWTVQL